MKMVFICGALEPGKDGVGDYTRRLSAALIKQGISVSILAYNDKFINKKIEELQSSDGSKIPCLRIPHTWSAKQRTQQAKKWVDKYNPDWVSLQFVIYSFNNKGLPFGLSKEFLSISKKIKVHVMFHELWIGMNLESSKKERFIGFLQRQIIKAIIKKNQPQIITTQTTLYLKKLKEVGIAADILPLFSNIPNLLNIENTNLIQKLPKENFFVFFGTLHKGAPIIDFLSELKSKGEKISFVAVGRNGSELNIWEKILKKYEFNLYKIGEQSEKIISIILSQAKYGISTTPYHLVEKSGSVIAMLSHETPVICLSKSWQPFNYKEAGNIDGVIEYKKGKLTECLNSLNNYKDDKYSISKVSKAFYK